MRKDHPLCEAAGILCLFSSAAIAQTVPPDNAATQASRQSDRVEEVIVTAEKRSERLQDVPLSVSAFSADTLAKANVANASDLTKIDPGLVIDAGTGVIRPFLHGIGNPSPNVGNEASIAFYIDGVYYARLPNSFFEFNNIERVEVLDGPQGTLFGRNASGGLVQIITKEPTQQPTVHAEVGYGNYDTLRAQVYASAGYGDKVAADIALLYTNQGDGWGRDITTGLKAWYEDDKAARSKWVFTPWDDTKLTVSLGYRQSKNDLGLPVSEYNGTTLGSSVGPPRLYLPLDNFYDTRVNIEPYTRDEGWDVSGRLEHQFSFMSFSSITAYQHATGVTQFDPDFTEANFFDAQLHYQTQETTQEFQFTSLKDSPVDWIVGLYYMNDLAAYAPVGFLGSEFDAITGVPGTGINNWSRQRINSYAGYSQAKIHVLDDSDITLGARYTFDQLTASGHTDFVLPFATIPGALTTASKNFEKATYKIAFDHHFTEDIMGYASYSRGFKDGTYNLLPFNPTPVNPEVVDAVEVGFKTSLLENRLRLNGSFFYDQIHNPQVQETVGNFIVYVNAGGAEVKGAEFNAEAKITSRLTGRLGLTVLDATYTSFRNAPTTSINPNPPYGNFAYSPFNAAGKDLSHAPPVTFNVGADYVVPTSFGDWDVTLSYYYNDGYYWDPDNRIRQPSYGLLDGQVSWSLPGDNWRVAIWGKNLTGAEYYLYEAEEGTLDGYPAGPAAPRTYGITLSYDL